MFSEKLKNIIIDFLSGKIPNLDGIYIYGSFASNKQTPKSDIDIAFLSETKIDSYEKWKNQEKLAVLLDRDVDLVDLKDASVVLRIEVVNNGILILEKNKYKIDSFEMTTYSMYADLNETRIDILNDFKNRYGRNPDS